MTTLLGIDIGTTALKCAVFDLNGNALAVSTREYPLLTPKVNFVEVPAETYWTALKNGLDDLKKTFDFTGNDIAVSFSPRERPCCAWTPRGVPCATPSSGWTTRRGRGGGPAGEIRDEQCYAVTGR